MQEGRAGRARSDPSRPRRCATPESGRAVSGRRRTEAVPADLDALRRVADDAGACSIRPPSKSTAKGKDGADYLFRATGSVPKFDGFLKVYEEGKDQKDEDDEELKHQLPAVTEGESSEVQDDRAGAALHRAAAALQRSDAGEGAGSRTASAGRRPTRRSCPRFRSASTSRRKAGKFTPTELGMVVTDLLLESFDDIFDVQYTARMEEELDEIEEGKLDWRAAMSEFYEQLREGPGARRRAHDRHQADGEAHRLDLREVRQAAW